MHGGGGVTVSVGVLKAIFLNHTNVSILHSQFPPQISQIPKMKRNFATPLKWPISYPFFMHFFSHETRNFTTPSFSDVLIPLLCICIFVCYFDFICPEICAFDEFHEHSDNLDMQYVPCSEANM